MVNKTHTPKYKDHWVYPINSVAGATTKCFILTSEIRALNTAKQ